MRRWRRRKKIKEKNKTREDEGEEEDARWEEEEERKKKEEGSEKQISKRGNVAVQKTRIKHQPRHPITIEDNTFSRSHANKASSFDSEWNIKEAKRFFFDKRIIRTKLFNISREHERELVMRMCRKVLKFESFVPLGVQT